MPEDSDISESTIVDSPEVSSEVSTEPGESYIVKIDGNEEQVTLSELRDGYQRQADYKRKTQDLATERQRLQQADTIVSALEADPRGTLQALSNAYGIEKDTQPASPRDSDPWEDDEVDPTDQRLAKIEATLEQQAQLTRQQTLQREVSSLKSKYGDFNEQDLFQHALKNRIPNLDAAYAHMRFGEVTQVAQQLRADQEVTEAKRDTAPVASGGSTQAGAVVSNVDAGKKVSSLREAVNLAKRQHS